VEHSSDSGLRGFSAFLAAGAAVAAGADVAGAGAVVCANAEPIRSTEAKAVATAREDRVIMGAPQVEEARKVGWR
jgi:hypothetical protein